MIISHKYKFIFIKTEKTAGTSIEVFLSQFCALDDILTPIWPHIAPHCPRNHQGPWNPLPEIISNKGRGIKGIFKNVLKGDRFYNHIPAAQASLRISSKVWNSYFKFCVERNPWDKTLSHYYMINDRAGGNLSFDDYLNEGNFSVNVKKYTDSSGNLLVDRVVKYECLMDELGVIFHELGIPFDGSLGVRAKSEHRKDKRPYQEVFSKYQRNVIEQAFAQEIEMHNYVF